MGWGDALIAAGQAQDRYQMHPERGPVAICDRHGRPRWNPVWAGNRRLVPTPPLTPFRTPHVVSGKDALPYLKSPSPEGQWLWSDWRVRDHRPRLYLTPQELALGRVVASAQGPFVLLEPTAARKAGNRQPPRAFWQALRQRLTDAGLTVVQLAHPDAELLPGVVAVPHEGFREACGILAAATVLVSTEGGLPHAAAALGTPAVVLWGGCVSAPALAYPEHVNLVDDDPQTPCGRLTFCAHCEAAWARLTVERVSEAVVTHWQERS